MIIVSKQPRVNLNIVKIYCKKKIYMRNAETSMYTTEVFKIILITVFQSCYANGYFVIILPTVQLEYKTTIEKQILCPLNLVMFLVNIQTLIKVNLTFFKVKIVVENIAQSFHKFRNPN